jgi:hypothetical protein
MMGRSLVFGSVAAAGLLTGSTTLAEAGDPHCHYGRHHSHRYGYPGHVGIGVGIGYGPRPVYAPPPAYYYGPPVYPQPAYVAPYPYGYAPYPASGLGISTKSFGLWLGR